MDKANKYSYLIKNSLIFAVGTFGSKVLQFLIVPLYTYVLTTTEYGIIDLFTTTVSLLIPFATLLIQEALIRFLTSREVSNQEAINIGFSVFVGSCILSIFAGIGYAVLFNSQLAIVFYVCLVLNSYMAIFQNYLKACEKIKEFTICGLLNTFIFLFCNVMFLTVFKLGMKGYLVSLIISLVFSSIYITIKGNIIKEIDIKKLNKQIFKEMLMFSIPLIPNNLMWWIMNAGDKYIINYFLGNDANGIYSVSIKLATIVSTLFGIFMQSWQLSAIKESEDNEVVDFYNKVYVMVMALLFISSSLIIAFTRPFFLILINRSFFDANKYSPLLCVATILNCLSTFAGVIYVVNKKTKKAFSSTALGAVVNIIANLILIKNLGLVGIALGTIIGYFVVVVLRIIDMKKYINMNFDWVRTIASFLILFGVSIIYFFVDDMYIMIIGILCTMVIILLYKREFIKLVKLFLFKFVRKRQ